MSYCELPEFFSASYHIARKKHVCCECAAPILPKEKYGAFTGKWGGDVNTYKQHLDCESACVFIRDNFNSGECISFGELGEVWKEYTRSHFKKRHIDENIKKFRLIMARILKHERRLLTKKERRLGA